MTTLRDFLPESNIMQSTMWPILPIRCTCGPRLGALQRKIESMIGVELERLEHDEPELSRVDRFGKARSSTFESLGITKECCLLALTFYPFYTVNDLEGEDAYLDCTATNGTDRIAENIYLSYHSDEIPKEFFPKTRNKLGFDMDVYCQKLFLKTLETSDRQVGSTLHSTSLTGESAFPKFPFLSGVDVREYPSIITTIPPPTFPYEDEI